MSDAARYHFREAEAKWQKLWEKNESFKAREDAGKPKYYVLEMFPYPSGNIHMGHVRNYTLGDVVARAKRMQGFNVLHPMGWDAFGLPAENAAIQNNSHPGDWTFQNIATMREQLKLIGLSYDWSRELATCSPDYYKHEQTFFLKFLQAGLAYRKEAEVNWDPVDNTVLANEQVIDGRGWRSGALVERRKLSQWFLRISDYAEDLLSGLDTLKEWPEKVRIMQERWIGKSQGAMLELQVAGCELQECKTLKIYTTRPETLFGMSFCAVSPGHPLAAELGTRNSELSAFIAECQRIGTSEEAIEKAEKKGFDTGLKIVHPFDGREVPLYVANFVLMDYGTGAIFACPAHDERDFEFATKYNLPIIPVVAGGSEPLAEAYTGDGVMINSDFLNGMDVAAAKKRMLAALEAVGVGTAKTNYRLRDWGISRQRYWGCPIPIIHCEACGIVPVPEEQLPVELPKDVTFDKPGNPLEHHPTWKHTPCPACGKQARRETDTFDTFFESSWYFSRFASMPSEEPLHSKSLNYWLPVDCYIGGIEHAVLHLLYSRFFTRALKACGQLEMEEPFKRLETQGMICHETYKNSEGKWLSLEEAAEARAKGEDVAVGRSEKMSKSKKNTVDPRAMMSTYGADAARLFMLSDSPPERDLEWTDAGIEGAWRYLNRLWKLVQSAKESSASDSGDIKKLTHKTIAAVTDDIEKFHFNKAIARIRELTNALEKSPDREGVEVALHLLSPFLPHIAEECWQALGHTDMLSTRPWPVADKALLVDDSVTIAVQINGKMKTTLDLPKDLPREETEARVFDLQQVKDALGDKQVKKIVVVPNRIVNVVVG
ncbi:MAG: leucine--tRNA ligase [Alphaproteobacteria bacterium]|nr:leucine--tRNA ligase [Alphaproteobacteria bacterium]